MMCVKFQFVVARVYLEDQTKTLLFFFFLTKLLGNAALISLDSPYCYLMLHLLLMLLA